jgi:lipopolysaccharide export system permease protein
MKLIDRQLVASYVKSYVVCLVSLLGLYIVIDLFTNIDDFAGKHSGLAPILKHIGTYYGYRIPRIFDQMCEMLALLAAMFTVAWMQRSNELLPLLSAGVSTRRVVRPVIFAACGVLAVGSLNQELLIPRLARALLADRDDPMGDKEIGVRGAYEPNGILVEGRTALRKNHLVKEFSCVIPERVAGNITQITADEAYYLPPGSTPRGGGWLLIGAKPAELEGANFPCLEMIDPGKYFLATEQVDFEAVTRARSWFVLASTRRIREELSKPDSTRLAAIAVLFHMRLTRPILGILLVVMGLSVILRDQNRNLFISAGLCLVLCAVFFAACFACKQFGDNEYVSPSLAAWLPVLMFGPLAFVLFDAVHT